MIEEVRIYLCSPAPKNWEPDPEDVIAFSSLAIIKVRASPEGEARTLEGVFFIEISDPLNPAPVLSLPGGREGEDWEIVDINDLPDTTTIKTIFACYEPGEDA